MSSLFRQWVFNSVQGLASRFARELEDKLEAKPIVFGFDRLGHVPVMERAAAVARLVDKAKMPLGDARAVVGW